MNFTQHQKWVNLFKDWWKEGISSWRNRNQQGDCIFLCELGPPEYAMTDSDGKELSNRWEEAIQIKNWIAEMWEGMEKSERR